MKTKSRFAERHGALNEDTMGNKSTEVINLKGLSCKFNIL